VVHLGFLPETGQGLIILVNLDLASTSVTTLAYSAYDRLLGLAPLDWERKLADTAEPDPEVRDVALDLPIETLVGTYAHPAYGVMAVRVAGNDLAIDLGALHLTLAYQGQRQFVSREPIAPGGPHISVRFSTSEPRTLFATLNFEPGDPVQAFVRASDGAAASVRSAPTAR
jgi:hypothetical protein